VVEADALEEIRRRLDRVYQLQVEESGLPALQRIQEEDLARCPLAYDPFFLDLALHPAVLEPVRALLGQPPLLHLQNGIINRPGTTHHQAAWHRDLPYQDFVSSVPLAVSALLCVDPFSAAAGGTLLLPFSHRLDHLPSEEYLGRHAVAVEADAGTVVLFDAMTYHRAGANRATYIRRAINHVYTIPLIKQQISLPAALGLAPPVEESLRAVLGYGSESAESPLSWRRRRQARLERERR
jgi:ectoine hydroxylase-related dioxygenase (phytanoyl-CoA dioxygenase family)